MRFNHMELTLPRGTLSDKGRKEISAFYSEIFGWGSIDVELFDQKNLLLHTDDEVSQFILLSEKDKPMHSPSFDHLGCLVDTRAEVDDLHERCERYRERDDRVQILKYDDLDQKVVVIHAFYVKYILPIYFDVQCMEWTPEAKPARDWTYG